MAEIKSVKELKELLVFLAAIGNAVDASTKDGLGWEDVGAFVPAFMLAQEAFVGLAEIPLEAKDLSVDEMKEIEAAIASQLSLEDKKLEGVIEKAFSMMASLYGLVMEIKALREEPVDPAPAA